MYIYIYIYMRKRERERERERERSPYKLVIHAGYPSYEDGFLSGSYYLGCLLLPLSCKTHLYNYLPIYLPVCIIHCAHRTCIHKDVPPLPGQKSQNNTQTPPPPRRTRILVCKETGQVTLVLTTSNTCITLVSITLLPIVKSVKFTGEQEG